MLNKSSASSLFTIYGFGKIFCQYTNRIGKGERSKSNEGRRQITCHPFMRFVKSTIFDLGYFDYSERFMGYMV